MTASLLIQVALFIGAVSAGTRALRSFPRYRVKSHSCSVPLAFLAWALAVSLPLGIAYVGHGSLQAGEPRVSALTTLFLCIGVSAMYVGWCASPAGRRKRCPSCWYDMEGETAERCPECGRVVRSATDLSRTRRSRRLLAVGALLVSMSYVTLKGQSLDERGWAVFVPTTPVIVLFPWIPHEVLAVADSPWIQSRETLWPWQEQMLEWRARRLFRNTSNAMSLVKASRYLSDDEASIKMREEAAVSLANQLDKRQLDMSWIMALIYYLPESVSPPAQQAMLDPVVRAITSGDRRTVDAATHLGLLLTGHCEEVAEAFNAAVRTSASGMWGLAHVAACSERAWQLYKSHLTSPDATIRKLAVVFAPDVPADAAPFLNAALNDDNVEVAIAAVRRMSRGRMSPMTVATAERLLDVAERRPELRAEVVGCNWPACSERLADLLRAMLQSPAVSEREAAISAAGRCHPPLRSLADDLARMDTTGLDEYALRALAAAMEAIRAREKRSAPDEPQ